MTYWDWKHCPDLHLGLAGFTALVDQQGMVERDKRMAGERRGEENGRQKMGMKGMLNF